MSMSSITGELGIGKTYHLSKELYNFYLQGCLCISNYQHVYSHVIVKNDPELLVALIRELCQFKQRGYEIYQLIPTFKHGGVFYGIDEAHLVFGRELREEMQDVVTFLSLARKQDVAVYYVCQDPAMIHKTFRRYTNDWLRYRALIPLYKKILVPHPTLPTMRRERRLVFPWVWEEVHKLNYENPVFSYAKKHVEGIGNEWAPTATLISRKIHRTNDPFVFKLYDSHEMIGLKETTSKQSFPLLRTASYIPHTFYKERFPFFKKILGLQRTDEVPPTRYSFKTIDLPIGAEHDVTKRSLKQPEKLLEDIRAFMQYQDIMKGMNRTQRKHAESKERNARKETKKQERPAPSAPEKKKRARRTKKIMVPYSPSI